MDIDRIPGRAWGTADEMKFVANLGSHRTGAPLSPQERVALIEQYAATMADRVEWGDIDREALLDEIAILVWRLKTTSTR